MVYTEALEYCDEFANNKSSMGLNNMKILLKMLGNPEENLKFIHVAGTNGKGSVVSYIAEILAESGFKTGKYISPHLNKINERISVNGELISDTGFAECISQIHKVLINKGKLTESLTMFEILTCAAFLYFKKTLCDICVLETGLGGRLDATNVIKDPLINVITPIGYDHMRYLGNTIESIAAEKAAIMKKNNLCIIAPQRYESVYKIIEETSKSLSCETVYVDKKQITITETSIHSQEFMYKNMKNLKITLLGGYQTENAATAVEVVFGLLKYGIEIERDAIYSGLKKTKWQCRLELINTEPLTLIDGAHNIDGVRALIKFTDSFFPGRKITYIFGVMKDKEYDIITDIIKPTAKTVHAVGINHVRALDVLSLCSMLKNHGIQSIPHNSVKEAIDCCFEKANKDDLICIFGSLYMSGEAREYILKTKEILP